MTEVVLRCPKCGTTQSHTGECDACYEGQVRYYCGNHRPGLWLDGPVCNSCGAKFGEAPKAPPPPRAPTPSRTPPATPSRPASGRAAPGRSESDPRYRKAPRSDRSPPDREVAPPGITLADLVARALAARGARARYDEETWGRAPEIGHPRAGNRGCLLKALLMIAVLLAFVLGGPSILLSGFLQYFL